MMRFRACFFYRGTKAEIEQRIDETLELMRLDDKADRTISGFSGGELQRLGIGLVLVLVNQVPDIKPSALK